MKKYILHGVVREVDEVKNPNLAKKLEAIGFQDSEAAKKEAASKAAAAKKEAGK